MIIGHRNDSRIFGSAAAGEAEPNIRVRPAKPAGRACRGSSVSAGPAAEARGAGRAPGRPPEVRFFSHLPIKNAFYLIFF